MNSLIWLKLIGETMETPLVIEAVGYVINEILEIYGQIIRRFLKGFQEIEGGAYGEDRREVFVAGSRYLQVFQTL